MARSINSDRSGDIAWTDKLRGRIYASRAIPNPLHLGGGYDTGPCWLNHVWPLDLETCWTDALDVSWGGVADWAEPPNAVPRGLLHATPQMATLAERACAAFGKRLATLDADVEAAMATLALRKSWSGFPLWCAMHGEVFALRVLLKMAASSSSEHEHAIRDHGLYLRASADHAASELFEHKNAWRMLRGVIAAANDDVYAEARTLADAVRRSLAPEFHAAVAFAFPDEPWGNDAADAMLASSGDGRWEPVQMLVTVAEPARGVQLAKLGYPLELHFLVTMLAHHGARAVPVLAAALDSVASGDARKEIADVLAMVRTQDALEAFLPWLGKSAVATPLKRAFKAQPEVAAKLLKPHATGTGKPGTAAKAILAKLA